MIFTIERGLAVVVVEQGWEIEFEHSMSRQQFLTQFDLGDIDSIQQLSYEPAPKIYHILNVDKTVEVCAESEVDAHPIFSVIKQNAAAIEQYFRDDKEANG